MQTSDKNLVGEFFFYQRKTGNELYDLYIPSLNVSFSKSKGSFIERLNPPTFAANTVVSVKIDVKKFYPLILKLINLWKEVDKLQMEKNTENETIVSQIKKESTLNLSTSLACEFWEGDGPSTGIIQAFFPSKKMAYHSTMQGLHAFKLTEKTKRGMEFNASEYLWERIEKVKELGALILNKKRELQKPQNEFETTMNAYIIETQKRKLA